VKGEGGSRSQRAEDCSRRQEVNKCSILIFPTAFYLQSINLTRINRKNRLATELTENAESNKKKELIFN
jgi:hypothetical protein